MTLNVVFIFKRLKLPILIFLHKEGYKDPILDKLTIPNKSQKLGYLKCKNN